MAATLNEDLASDLVRMVLQPRLRGWAQAEWLLVAPLEHRGPAPLPEVTSPSEPMCGRLVEEKLQSLFGARAADVERRC